MLVKKFWWVILIFNWWRKRDLTCQIKDLKDIFELFDEDASGHIDMEELGKMMDGLGRTLSEDELKNIYEQPLIDKLQLG